MRVLASFQGARKGEICVREGLLLFFYLVSRRLRELHKKRGLLLLLPPFKVTEVEKERRSTKSRMSAMDVFAQDAETHFKESETMKKGFYPCSMKNNFHGQLGKYIEIAM